MSDNVKLELYSKSWLRSTTSEQINKDETDKKRNNLENIIIYILIKKFLNHSYYYSTRFIIYSIFTLINNT